MAFYQPSCFSSKKNNFCGDDTADAAQILANMPSFINLSAKPSETVVNEFVFKEYEEESTQYSTRAVRKRLPLEESSLPSNDGVEDGSLVNSSTTQQKYKKTRACKEHRRKHQRCPSYCSGRTPKYDSGDSSEGASSEDLSPSHSKKKKRELIVQELGDFLSYN